MDSFDIERVAVTSGSVLGLLGTIWVGVKTIYPRIKKWFSRPARLEAILESEVIPFINLVKQELTPDNMGVTLRDMIKSLKKDVELAKHQVMISFQREPVPLIRFDHEGFCLAVNDKFVELSGIPAAESLHNGWVLSIQESERNFLFETWRDCFSDQRPFEAGVHIKNHQTKVIQYVMIRAIYFKTNDELLGGLLVIEEVSNDGI
jgi:PAS domain-containing protein